MFKALCSLIEDVGDGWKHLTDGEIIIYYDLDLLGARVVFNDTNGEAVTNTIIGSNSAIQVRIFC